MSTEEKLVIIGSGPAALTAAIYASRAGISPLLIEGKTPGGQLMNTTYVENWPGIKRVLGPQLMMDMREQAVALGARIQSGEVVSTDFSNKPFKIVTNKNTITTETVIIATGSTPKKLNVPGEEEYWNKGVTTCAICDGAFYKDRKVVIVGGGDTAMEDASFMANLTKDITVVHILDKLTASHAMQKRVIKDPSVNIIYKSTISRIYGNGDHVTGVVIKNQETGEEQELPCDVVFIAVGLIPNSQPFKGQIELEPNGAVKVFEHTQTSVQGVFAAGDIVDFRYRQAITSAGTGCMAALDAERYMQGIF